MKTITKLLALVLTLVLVFSLTACASESIAGFWKSTLDFDAILAEMAKDESTDTAMLDTMSKCFEGLTMGMILELKEDKTFTLCIDDDSLTVVANQLEERLPAVIIDLVASMAGMTREEYEAALAAEGMSVDDALSLFGGSLSADSLLESMTFPAKTGTYTYEGGKLSLTADGETVVYDVELNGKELKITGVESGEEALPEGLMPLVFVK